MKNTSNNIRIIAERNNSFNGLEIYLDLSGQRELLMFRRYNARIFNILKEGRSFSELARGGFEKKRIYSGCRAHNRSNCSRALENSLGYIIKEAARRLGQGTDTAAAYEECAA